MFYPSNLGPTNASLSVGGGHGIQLSVPGKESRPTRNQLASRPHGYPRLAVIDFCFRQQQWQQYYFYFFHLFALFSLFVSYCDPTQLLTRLSDSLLTIDDVQTFQLSIAFFITHIA